MVAKKVVLSLEEIQKELPNKKNKKEYIKDLLDDEDYKNLKKDLLKELAPLVTKKQDANYNLIYDSLNEGLEPIYFWILDFMRDSSPAGLKLDVWKGPEDYEASVTSGYYGEMGQRATLMQQKAMEYLGAINNVIKSILNLIYDLKEFEIKLEDYDKIANPDTDPTEKKGSMHSLKGIWMDQVDVRKGRGSINMLAQELQFVTLRDAFFHVDTSQELENLDLNERVKNILLKKITEFNKWKSFSEREIRKRYEIERAYLKSQAGTLKLYAHWLKPYLIAAQKLKMRNTTTKSLTNPNIVNAFSNMEMEIKLYGKKEIKPEAIHESFADTKLDKKYYALIEVVMNFRSVPSTVSGQGGRQYIHGGRTEITINGYAVDDLELEAIESVELYEDLELIDEYIGTTTTQLQEDIEKYIKPPQKKEGGAKISTDTSPFGNIFKGFMEIYSPIKKSFSKKKKVYAFIYADMDKATKSKAKSLAYKVYNVYKKTHGMVNV